MSDWKQYRRKGFSEMRPYISGENMAGISISEPYRQNLSPKVGDMIARNPKDHTDQWLVAKQYFNDNLEPVQKEEQVMSIELERANQAKKEAARFEKAEKKTEWDGWVYLEGTGRDGYSESVGDFWDNWERDKDEDSEKPKYVWACKKNFFAVADVSDITERIADNGYEDFDPDDLNGLDDLKAAIEKFNEANKDVVSYEPDYGVAILLNDKLSDGSAAPSRR